MYTSQFPLGIFHKTLIATKVLRMREIGETPRDFPAFAAFF